MQPNLRGALFMSGSMAAFTINDAFVKLAGQNLPLFQILFLRSLAVFAFFLILIRLRGMRVAALGRDDRRLIAIRTLAEMGAAFFFLTALIHMPIANVTAVIQALPLTVTLGAALALGEPVGWRRVTAILVGFVGVFLIVRPRAEGFDTYTIYAIAAVGFVTIRDLAARRLSPEAPSLLVAAAAVVGVLALSAVGSAFTDWQPMSPRDWLWIAGSVGFIVGGYLFSVMAMRVGEIGFVAQFRYTSLLVALLLGLFVFGEWPSDLTLLGAAIVVATGLFTLWRERRVAPARALRPR